MDTSDPCKCHAPVIAAMIKPGAHSSWVDEAQINFHLCSCLINIATLGRQLLQIEAIGAMRWNQIYSSHLSLFFPTCHNQVALIKVTKNLFSQQHLICDFICSNVIACTNLDRIWNSPKHWNSFKILTLSNKQIYRIAFTKSLQYWFWKAPKMNIEKSVHRYQLQYQPILVWNGTIGSR